MESAIATFRPREGFVPNPKLHLREQLHEVMRFKQFSLRTESAYWGWIKQFMVFHRANDEESRRSPLRGWRHPRAMGKAEVEAFLTHLAKTKNVAVSTQNQALNALVFLYREVLHQPFGLLEAVERPLRRPKIPVVMSRAEVNQLLGAMEGTAGLIARLLYGTGMRLMELLRLRIKDVDLARNVILIHGGKGDKDRATIVPDKLKLELQQHLQRVRLIWEEDVRAGRGAVYLPEALARKYPQAATEWCWQYVFPSKSIAVDPESRPAPSAHPGPSSIPHPAKSQPSSGCATFSHPMGEGLLPS